MKNFLNRLVERNLGEADGLQPRLPSLFEPVHPSAVGGWSEPLAMSPLEQEDAFEDEREERVSTAFSPAATKVDPTSSRPTSGRDELQRAPFQAMPPPPRKASTEATRQAGSQFSFPKAEEQGPGKALMQEDRDAGGSPSTRFRGRPTQGQESHPSYEFIPKPLAKTAEEHQPRRGAKSAEVMTSQAARLNNHLPENQAPAHRVDTGRWVAATVRQRTTKTGQEPLALATETKSFSQQASSPHPPPSVSQAFDAKAARLAAQTEQVAFAKWLTESLYQGDERASRQRQGEAPAEPMPTIQVTIGRIEVRATPAASAPRRSSAKAPRPMSLDEYLQRRNRGGP